MTDSNMVQSSTSISLRSLTILMYGLEAFSFLFGITGIVAIIINYLKFGETVNTLYESHFIWLRRTFWFSLLWAILGLLTSEIIIGIFILIANAIWVIYRVIKGFILVLENKPAQQNNFSKEAISA